MKSDTRDAATTGPIAFCWAQRYISMIGVDNAVRVIATLIAHAKHRHDTGVKTEGKRKVNALPNAAPEAKRGKMNPPLNPPATEKEIATNLANPTKRHDRKDFISKPNSPVVGKTWGNNLAGYKLARVSNSISPQNIVCGNIIPRVTMTNPPRRDLTTAFLLSIK